MWSESAFFWGIIFPLILMGIAIGFVLFVAIPWAWPFVKHFIVWSLT